MTERQRSNTWMTALCVCCASWVAAQPARSADTVLAILPGDGASAPPAQVVAQWEVTCSQAGGLVLVERALIRKVLAEQALAAGGMAGANSMTLGRLLAADLFVFLDKMPGTNAICRTRAVEAATGLLLGEELWNVQAAPEAPARMTHFARAAAAKRAVPLAHRHFVGLLGVRSEESTRRLDETARTLEFLLSEALSAEPRVTMLDREHLEHLQTERALTDIEQRIKEAAHVLNVGLRAAAEKERLSAAIVLQSLTGGRPLTTNVVMSAQDLGDARRRIADAVSALLRFESAPPAATPAATPGDAQAEARVYAEQASLWLTWKQPDNAARAAGAAFALEPSQANRLLWATALSGQTSLTAILRTRELLSDYYDVHLKAIRENRESNLMLPSFGFAGVSAFVPADDAETTALKEAIMEADDRLSRRRLAHYAKYYDALWTSDAFNATPYWTMWRERALEACAYSPGRPDKRAELLHEAADAFTISPSSRHNEMVADRIAMLGEVAFRMHRRSRGNKCDTRFFIPLFQELTSHRDPYVRLMAHVALNHLDFEPTQSARAVYDILLKEITPAHSYRNYWYAEKRLFYYISWLQIGSTNAAPAILEAKAQLLHAIVASDDPQHFDGVMEQPGLGWLVELSTNNRLDQADNLAKQLIDFYERKHVKNPYTDARRAVTRLVALRQEFAKQMGQAVADTTPTNAAVWDQFEFVKLRDATLPGETFLSLIETDQIYCVKTAPLLMPRGVEATTTSVVVVRYDLRSGQTVPLGTTHVKRYTAVVQLVRLNDWLFLREYNSTRGYKCGLFVLSLRDGMFRYLTERDGLPGSAIQALCPFGDHLYLSFGDPWHDKSASVVCYDPRSNTFEIVASTRSVAPRNALDGLPFSIGHILPDTKRQCLWLLDNTVQNGIHPILTKCLWKYVPAQGTMTHVLSRRFHGIGSILYPFWNNGEELGPTSGVGLISEAMREKEVANNVAYGFPTNANLSEDELFMIEFIGRANNASVYQQDQDRVVGLSVYPNGCAEARLMRMPDGRPFPGVGELRRVFQGAVVSCGNGEVYWIFEKSQTAFRPPGSPIRFATDLSGYKPEKIGNKEADQRRPAPALESAVSHEQMIEALKAASRKCEEKRGSGSDDFRQAIQTAAPLLRPIAVSTQMGHVAISKYTLNSRGLGLDGLRFKTPAGMPSQLLWVFAKPTNSPLEFYFAPTQGTLPQEAFRCVERFDHVTGPWPQGYTVFIQPFNVDLPPTREFLVWFHFKNNQPVDLFIGILLAPITSGSSWVWEARKKTGHGHGNREYGDWQNALGLPWKAAPVLQVP